MYVSNVIDQLTDELEDRISAVAEHLDWSLRKAEQCRDWSPRKSFRRENLGNRPAPISMPAFPPTPYLSAWHRFSWSFYGEAKRQSVLDKNVAYQGAHSQFQSQWQAAIAQRQREMEQFDLKLRAEEQAVLDHNESVRQVEDLATRGDIEAQWQVFEPRFAAFMRALDPLTGSHRITYSADSHRVVVEFDVPAKSVVPAEKSVRFLKTTGEHRYSYRTDADLKRMYAAFVSQAVLGVINGAIRLSPPSLVETVGVNAVVDAPDPPLAL